MNVINSLEKISNKLEEIGFDKEPGSILYSGNETLSKGNFYFLGLNPGGNTNLSVSEDTVINQLKKKDSTFNEYFQGVWKERGKQPTPPGQSILQQRIKILFSRLRVDLRKTCSSNLVFVIVVLEKEIDGGAGIRFVVCFCSSTNVFRGDS